MFYPGGITVGHAGTALLVLFFPGHRLVIYVEKVFLLLTEGGEVSLWSHARGHKQGAFELMHRSLLPASLPLPQDGTQSRVPVPEP